MLSVKNVYEINLTKRRREPMHVTIELEKGTAQVLDVLEPKKRLVDEMDALNELIRSKSEDDKKELSSALWQFIAHMLSNNTQGIEISVQFAEEEIDVDTCWELYGLYVAYISGLGDELAKK